MNDPMKSREDEHIDQTAADWLIRRDRGLSAAEQDEFFQWLAADPRHGERFAQHQRTWKEFNLLAQWRPEHGAEPNPDLLAKPRRASRWRAWAAPLALAAAVVVGFVALHPAAPATARLVRDSELRELPDGSIVELNRDSQIAVDFTGPERRVDLLRGEAHFTVAKRGPEHPFVVMANGVRVRAVGTVFNVRLDGSAVDVLVTEGKVRVDPPKPDEPGVSGALNAAMVAAGERATVDAAVPTPLAPQVVEVSSAEVEQVLAWQGLRIKLNDTPLEEAVAEFNRHNDVQLVIADARIERLPLGGNFRLDNAEAFVRMLESTAGVRAERSDGRCILRARVER